MADQRRIYPVSAAAAVIRVGLDIGIPVPAVPHACTADAHKGRLACVRTARADVITGSAVVYIRIEVDALAIAGCHACRTGQYRSGG